MIEVKDLTKRYGDHLAVDHLSFCVQKGQVYGFLGPNGAGKSTTMNIITGYIAPTEGTVLIDGKDIVKEPEEAKKHIGYLPELPPVYMDMTVKEYLQFVAQVKQVPKKERVGQLNDIMQMTGVFDVQGRLIKNLSKGYRQRVGLAQAIVGYPDVIILDEPTVGLDPKQIIEIRELIQTLSERHTIILSSHILSEVSAVCDHIMIISKGKLIASDSPENLQKKMSEGTQLQMCVKGEAGQVENCIKAVPGVTNVEVREKEEGFVACVVSMEKDTDCRELVFYTLAAAKLPIMEMKYEKRTLEDIFLELTEGAKEPAMQSNEKKEEMSDVSDSKEGV